MAIPGPNSYRCPIKHCRDKCDMTCLDVGFGLYDSQTVGAPAAVMVEPIQSSAGIIVPPEGYFVKLKALCDERGLLVIFDEAQTGLGRLGSHFAFEQLGIVPDILTLSKTLGNGVPMAATVTSDEIEEECFDRSTSCSTHRTFRIRSRPPSGSRCCACCAKRTSPRAPRRWAKYFIDGLARAPAALRMHRRRARPRAPDRARDCEGPGEPAAGPTARPQGPAPLPRDGPRAPRGARRRAEFGPARPPAHRLDGGARPRHRHHGPRLPARARTRDRLRTAA